jgi:hypothetical protein
MGELVVQNGRLSGARRALHAPLTLIGQAENCDIRLTTDGVSLMHCVLVQGSGWLVLHDLRSEAGTFVNGTPITTTVLHNGDLLTIGSCRFRVRLPEGTPPTAPLFPKSEENDGSSAAGADLSLQQKEALRLQTAAVVAQQAAVTEDEARLEQRHVALEQQEAQLAAHLEQQRQRLLDLRDQVHKARGRLNEERTAFQEHVRETNQKLETTRLEVTDNKLLVQAERRRLRHLQNRLKHRWHRHWLAERAAMDRRAQELAEQRQRFQREQADLMQARLHFQSEMELARGQLASARDQLLQEKAAWHTQQANEQMQLSEEASRLADRAASLREAERALEAKQTSLDEKLALREKEAQGLEERIHNYRHKLDLLEADAARHTTPVSPVPVRVTAVAHSEEEPQLPAAVGRPSHGPVIGNGPHEIQVHPLEVALQRRAEFLNQLAGDLADQRLHLAEQCARFIQAQQQWQGEHTAAATEMETMGRRLQDRERSLDIEVERLRRSQAEAACTRRFLEAWQARLAVRVSAWEGERDRCLADVQAREDRLERRRAIMDRLRSRWHQRLQQLATRLRDEYAACGQLRTEWTALRGDWQERSMHVQEEQRRLTAQAMALKRYREKLLQQTSRPGAAAGRLDRLSRRWEGHLAAAQERLAKDRRLLAADWVRLEERYRHVQELTKDLAARQAEIAGREMANDQAGARTLDEAVKTRQEVESLTTQHDICRRQLAEANAEVERLVHLLLSDADPTSQPLQQAA